MFKKVLNICMGLKKKKKNHIKPGIFTNGPSSLYSKKIKTQQDKIFQYKNSQLFPLL